MPSPFPGMDPFIEAQRWEGFHADLNTTMRQLINAVIPPPYAADTETRVIVSRPLGGRPNQRVADVAITRPDGPAFGSGADSKGGLAVLETVETEFMEMDDLTEHYVVIRDTNADEVVTVIETLSPNNKQGAGGSGTSDYARKQREVLASQASLVEIDLLRRGRRPMFAYPVPESEYAVMLHRGWQRPKIQVTPVRLLDRLPKIGVPLREGEGDVPLDLQEAVDTVYARGLYERLLRYDEPIDPPLPEAAVSLVA